MTLAGLVAVALTALILLLAAALRPSARAVGSDGVAPAAATARTGGRPPATLAGPEPSHAELPARDLDEALRITGGSLDIADALLEQMLAELPAQAEALATAATSGDWATARGHAHGIKGGTGVCAVPALHAAVCRLQSAVRSEDPAAIAAALGEIDRERGRLSTTARDPAEGPPLACARAP